MNAIDIKSVIVCDDIRREDNGKSMLIGVYTGDIVVPKFPANLSVSWFLQGKTRKTENRSLQLKIEFGANSKKPRSLIGAAEISAAEEGKDAVLILPGAIFTFEEETDLTLSVKEEDAWQELVRKKVVLSQTVDSASESSQPV